MEPMVGDVQKVLNSAVAGAADGMLAPGQQSRLKGLLDMRVAQVRDAIYNGNRTALSQVPGTLPPTGLRHVVFLVSMDLVASCPDLMAYVDNEWFKSQFRAAQDWLKEVEDGKPVLPPSMPDEGTASSGSAYGDSTGLEPTELTDMGSEL